MSADVFTSKVLERALDLKAEGMSWSRIAARLGVSDEGLKRRLVPGWAEQRQAGIRKARHVREGFAVKVAGRGQAGVRMAPADVEAALSTIPPDTRSLHARWMGDPLPGRSALDRLRKHNNATTKPTIRAARGIDPHGFLARERLSDAR